MDNVSPVVSEIVPENSNQKVNSFPKWYTRAAAYIIDGILISLVILPLSILPAVLGSLSGSMVYIISLVFIQIINISLISFYFAYFQSKEGKTLGMKWLGIEIKDINGNNLSFQSSLLRCLVVSLPPLILSFIPLAGPLVSLVYLGIIGFTILNNKNGQGFHDKMFNAQYSVTNEKTTAAKWVVGCYCGCLSIFIVLIVIGGAIGIGSLMSNPEFANLFPKMGETITTPAELPEELKPSPVPVTKNNKKIESPIESNSQTKEPKDAMQSEFYKACMEANTNSSVDLSEYCKCAEVEARKTSNVNTIVMNCKSKIMMK